MSDAGGALRELLDISRSGGTGEFLCVTASVEIGVYLQHGRVAWATVSSHPFEFARYLERRFGIDDGTFRRFVERCRRDRLPLGETLVASRLLALADVEAALRHQIGIALSAIATVPAGRTIFLQRRRFTEYSEAFTFDLPSLLPGSPAAPTEIEPAALGGAQAARFLSAVPGAVWMELLENGRLVEAAASYGKTAKIPTLWLYAQNDSYFAPSLAQRMAKAFSAAGGRAELHVLPPYADDGHSIADDEDGWDIWGQQMQAFLALTMHGDPQVSAHAPRNEETTVQSLVTTSVDQSGVAGNVLTANGANRIDIGVGDAMGEKSGTK